MYPSSSANSSCQILTVVKISLDSMDCHYFTSNMHRNDIRFHNAQHKRCSFSFVVLMLSV